MVEVGRIYPHALGLQIQPPRLGLVGKQTCAVVDVELVGLVGVVGQIKVQVTVIFDVDEQRPHADQVVCGPRSIVSVVKPALSVRQPKRVGLVHIDDVEVEPSVHVDVGGMGAAAL